MKNNGEDYKKLDYYVNLDESDKTKFEKLYLKYEGNHFKAQKAMQMDKRTNIISIVLFGLAFLLFIIGRERMMGTVIFLGFLDGVVTCYGFIYKLSGTNVLVSIVVSIIFGIIVALILEYILTAIFLAYMFS
ncbi:hypothetical protein FNSP4_14760 [Fusobacterium nucleatum]|nr:hypothetical protein FNCP4_08790 [Fusobacterium nucleatum]BEP03742.1 hypothetical protein FNSP4_14760 [Fusobacterium nucleatum]